MATYLPQELAFVDRAPVRIEGTAVVEGTAAEAWAVLLDYPSWPRWFGGGVSSCEATSDPATGIGSTRVVGLGPGGRLRFVERFIAWDDEADWAFTAIEGPGVFRSLVERCSLLELSPTRTRVTYRMAFDPKLGLKPLVPGLRRGIGRALTKGMEGLAAEVTARR